MGGNRAKLTFNATDFVGMDNHRNWLTGKLPRNNISKQPSQHGGIASAHLV